MLSLVLASISEWTLLAILIQVYSSPYIWCRRVDLSVIFRFVLSSKDMLSISNTVPCDNFRSFSIAHEASITNKKLTMFHGH